MGQKAALASPTLSDALPPLHVLSFVTASYMRWFSLLRVNLRLLALPGVHLSVCTGDKASLQQVNAMDISVLDLSRFVDASDGASSSRQVAERFGTAAYVSVVHAKTRCILSKLSQLTPQGDRTLGATGVLFFFDGDVTLFGDPRHPFANPWASIWR